MLITFIVIATVIFALLMFAWDSYHPTDLAVKVFFGAMTLWGVLLIFYTAQLFAGTS